MRKDWYKQYPNLNSAHFTIQNSGQYLQIPLPYQVSLKDNIDIEDRGIGNPGKFHPIGYCLNIPNPIKYHFEEEVQVGIMFENVIGEKVWFHFPKE